MPHYEFFCYACKNVYGSPSVNEEIVIVRVAVDPEKAKGEVFEVHMRPPRTVCSGALLRRNDGEGGPALLHVVAPTVRARDPAFLIVDESKNFRKCLPWKCRRLVVGTGAYGRLPVMKE